MRGIQGLNTHVLEFPEVGAGNQKFEGEKVVICKVVTA
jgi:hypothetical protein